jgi:anti-sigma regulatory factor (Ser/Thr protein kinase)
MAGRAYELAVGPVAPGAARIAADASCQRLSPPDRQTVRLLVSELVTNSVRHAGGESIDPIVVRFAVRSGLVRVAVTDHGHGFEPGTARPEGEAESGYGLYLVDRLADRWGTHDDGGAMTVWFELTRNRALPLSSARVRAAEAARAALWVTRFCLRATMRSARVATARSGRASPSPIQRSGASKPTGRRPPPEFRANFHSPRESDRPARPGGGASPPWLSGD